jgi:hypothetical protein
VSQGVGGNDLRWPGYLGRRYGQLATVLCVGHVHATDWEQTARVPLEKSLRRWLSSGRSQSSDTAYLESVREVFEWWLPTWRRWSHFRALVDKLQLDVQDIAWTNLAKCRVSREANPDGVVRVCQSAFPIREVVEALRPEAVLSCVKNAYEGGPIVTTWRSANLPRPLVFTWDGRRGTDRDGRLLRVWTDDAVRQIGDRRRQRG